MGILRRLTQVLAFLFFLGLLLYGVAQLQGRLESFWGAHAAHFLPLGTPPAWPAEGIRGVPVDSVLRLSPLAGLTAVLGGGAVIVRYVPALVVLVLAVFFGRFFCGWVCPLGSTLDTTDRTLARLRKGRTPRLYDGRRLKYYLLAVLLIGAPLGVSVAGWFDPLSLLTRSFALVVLPYAVWLGDRVGLALQDLPAGPLGRWWTRGWQAVLAEDSAGIYQYHALFFVLFVVLLGLGVAYRRYWCRNLCPLGALLGLVSGRNVLRRSVDGKCIACHKCERACPMGCITEGGKGTLAGECILCLRCQEVCPTDAVHFLHRQPREQAVAVDLSKRGFLATVGTAAVAVPMLRLNVARHREKAGLTVLRPPGARPEDAFLARCVRCGECMRVCPTRALQPTGLEAGLAGLWTPRLVPRIGYCVYECALCGQVCPSQAIERLTVEEKHQRALGKAKFNRSRCIPWRGYARFQEGLAEWEDCNCGTCEEACPVPGKAIRYNRFTATVGDKEIHIDRPYVLEDLCVGCGFCENVCPVPGEAAVRVEGPAGTATVADEAPVAIADWALEGWTLDGQPETYAGRDRLFQYINGAGEPYLTYAFRQVTVVHYRSNSQKLKVELWEFETPQEAFGAYSRDASTAATRAESLAHASASGEGEVWAWHGRHYLHVLDPNYMAPREPLVAATQTLLGRLPQTEPALPDVVAALPEADRVPFSVHYFHAALAAPQHRALPAELLGPDGLHIRQKTPAAFALYGSLESPSHAAVVVSYPTPAEAEAALQQCAQPAAQPPGKGPGDGVRVVRSAPDAFHAFVRKGAHLGAVLRAPSAEAAARLATNLRGRLRG